MQKCFFVFALSLLFLRVSLHRFFASTLSFFLSFFLCQSMMAICFMVLNILINGLAKVTSLIKLVICSLGLNDSLYLSVVVAQLTKQLLPTP